MWSSASRKQIILLFKENSYPYDIQVYRSTGFKYYFMRELENLNSYDELTAVTKECWSKIDENVIENYFILLLSVIAKCGIAHFEILWRSMSNIGVVLAVGWEPSKMVLS